MNMIKPLTLLIALVFTYSTQATANTVNVLSSNGMFAGNSASDLGTLSLLSDAQIASNLNDNDAATYLFGSSNNGTTSAQLDLQFVDNVYNQAGNDLAFYFVGGTTELNSMRICFSSNCVPTDSYDAGFITSLAVSIDDTNYALSAVVLDLSDFGFSNNELLGDFSIDLIAGGYNRLASIDSLHNVSAVPLPAAAWLFITGLGALGFISRRRK
jgi:hypothetical protein